MLTQKQIKIFEAFLRTPFKELSYKDIKQYSKTKSNSVIQSSIERFKQSNIIKKNKIQNVLLYSLNFENTNTISYLDLLVQSKLPKQVKICIELIQASLSELPFISIVIFGSYCDNKQTEKSDLDLAFFVSNKDDKRICELAVKSAEFKCILSLDAQIFTKDEMMLMLKDKKENLGKEIARKHLIVHNGQIFYSIIKEGIDHGFKIIY